MDSKNYVERDIPGFTHRVWFIYYFMLTISCSSGVFFSCIFFLILQCICHLDHVMGRPHLQSVFTILFYIFMNVAKSYFYEDFHFAERSHRHRLFLSLDHIHTMTTGLRRLCRVKNMLWLYTQAHVPWLTTQFLSCQSRDKKNKHLWLWSYFMEKKRHN